MFFIFRKRRETKQLDNLENELSEAHLAVLQGIKKGYSKTKIVKNMAKKTKAKNLEKAFSAAIFKLRSKGVIVDYNASTKTYHFGGFSSKK